MRKITVEYMPCRTISLDTNLLELGIEFMGVVNEIGRMENFSCKNSGLLSREKSEIFSMFFRLKYSLQREFDDELGSVAYSVTERENYRIISIPVSSQIILLGIRKDVNYIEITNKIKDLLSDMGLPVLQLT